MPTDIEALQMVHRLTYAAVRSAHEARERQWIAYADEQHRLVEAQLEKALSESSETLTNRRVDATRPESA